MRNLLIAVSALIVFGSLYPFDFVLPQDVGAVIRRFFNLNIFASSRGDILGNILLFVPFGVLAVLARLRHPAQAVPIGGIAVPGIVLALALQVLQLLLPGRDAALIDVFWNGLGIGVGIAIASTPQLRRLVLQDEGQALFMTVPVFLSLAWVFSQLAPLVPTLDLQAVKNSIKPLLFNPQFLISEVWLQLVAWLITLRFLATAEALSRYRHWLPAIPLITLLAQPFIVQSEVTLDKIIGVLGALAVWFSVRRELGAKLLASLLVAGLVLKSVAAADFSLRWNEFLWIPFSGFLEGSMLINTMALLEKMFLYGALVWLLREATLGWLTSAAATFGLLICLEWLQIYVPGRTAEITDPLLAVMIALAMFQLTNSPRSGNHEAAAKPVEHAPDRVPKPQVKGVNPSKFQHLNSLDGLRGIAALAVFFVHFNQTVRLEEQFWLFDLKRFLANGNTGVALFFVLSGFLLSIPFWKHHHSQADKPLDLKGYTFRRLTRILPAFYLCLLIILFAKAVAGQFPSVNNVLSHFLFLYNLKDGSILSLNPPFWTLAVEMQFYLLLPLLFIGLRRFSWQAAFATVVGLILLTYLFNLGMMSWLLARDDWPIHISLIWPFSLSITGPNSFVLKYSTLAHLTHFLIGVATAWVFLQKPKPKQHRGSSKGRKADLLFWSAAAWVLLILATPLDDLLQLPHARYNWPLVPLLLAIVVYNAPKAPIARKFLDSLPIRSLGVISYGVYIYHYPIQKVTEKIMAAGGLSVAEYAITFATVSFALTAAMASISYLLLERPVMDWARQRKAQRPGTANSVETQGASKGLSFFARAKQRLQRPELPARKPEKPKRSRWTKVTIELDTNQMAYLDKLSNREHRSLSGAARYVIAQYHRGLLQGRRDLQSLSNAAQPGEPDNKATSETAESSATVSPHTVNLRSEQADLLRQVSEKFETSLSQAAQRIINNVMQWEEH